MREGCNLSNIANSNCSFKHLDKSRINITTLNIKGSNQIGATNNSISFNYIFCDFFVEPKEGKWLEERMYRVENGTTSSGGQFILEIESK